MRKNKLMRAAAGLMVATLLTTSIISGTLAKYTTSGDGTDTARVAKFGVAINATGTTFAKSDKTDDETATTVTNSVSSKENVIAPGTKGTMADITLTGTPEVAVKVSYTSEFTLGDNWSVDNAYYCPLVITINGTDYDGTKYDSAKAFATAVNDAIKGYSKTYAPGTDLSSKTAENLKVSWKWAFEGNNAKDTKLGDASAAGNVSLKVTTTVTQID